MMLQVVASSTFIILITLETPMTAILTTLEVSFMLLENIYSTGITYDRHLQLLLKYFYGTGHIFLSLYSLRLLSIKAVAMSSFISVSLSRLSAPCSPPSCPCFTFHSLLSAPLFHLPTFYFLPYAISQLAATR